MGRLTGPVGEYMDPTVYRDRLPQPYRMLDKLLAEIVDHALSVAGENERKREEESRNQSDMFYSPTMNLDDLGHVTCYGANQGGSHLFVGNAEGQLLVVHVETQTVVVRSDVHPSPITALDVVTRGMGGPNPQVLLASSSSGLVCVYEVVFQDNVLNLKGTATPPPVTGAAAAEATLRFSSEGCELVLAAGQGALSAYRVPDAGPEAAGGKDKKAEPSPEDLAMPALLWVTEEAAREQLLCVEGQEVGPPTFHFRLRRRLKAPARPDGHTILPPVPAATASGSHASHPSGAADEEAEGDDEAPPGDGEDGPAGTAGLYCIWLGHNRMVAYQFGAVGEAQAATGGGGDDKDAAEGGGGGEAAPSQPVYDWVTPFPITASAMTDDGEHVATGLTNGAVVVWDDHMVQQNEVLPRVDGGVTCVSFADGGSAGLLVGTDQGLLYTCDLVRRVILRHEPPGAGPVEDMLLERGSTIAVLRRPGMRHQVYDVARRQAMGELAPPEGGVLELRVRALAARDAAAAGGALGAGLLLLGSSPAPAEGAEGAGPEGAEGGAEGWVAEGEAEGGDKPPEGDKDKEEGGGEGVAEGEGEAPPAAPAGSATLAVYAAEAWLRAAAYPLLTSGVPRGTSPMLERLLTDSEALAAGESPAAPRLKPVPPTGPASAVASPPRGAASLVASGRLAPHGQDIYINLPPSRSRSLAEALESTRTHRSARGTAPDAATAPAAATPPPVAAAPTDPELAEEDAVSRVHRTIVARGGGRRERRRRVEKAHGDLLLRLESIATARPSLLPPQTS